MRRSGEAMPTRRSMSRVRSLASSLLTPVWTRSVSAIWWPTVNTGSSALIGSWKIMAMRRPRMARMVAGAARGEIDAVEQDRAVEAGEIVRQQPQDRKAGDGLAAAALADDADALARRDVEIDLARRLPDALRGLEADAEAAHRHQRLRAAAASACRSRCAGCAVCHQPAARFFSFTSCSSISISVPMMPSRAS